MRMAFCFFHGAEGIDLCACGRVDRILCPSGTLRKLKEIDAANA